MFSEEANELMENELPIGLEGEWHTFAIDRDGLGQKSKGEIGEYFLHRKSCMKNFLEVCLIQHFFSTFLN